MWRGRAAVQTVQDNYNYDQLLVLGKSHQTSAHKLIDEPPGPTLNHDLSTSPFAPGIFQM